jgi:peptidoglycan/xylan/chitin deacetylase (PgdA/CDA1 family)
MRIPGLKQAKLTAIWLKSRFIDRALILGYHRVTDYRHDPFNICITPEHLSEQIEILSQHTRPISLKELVHGMKKGNIPKRSVAVTFDDGYADILYHAKPLLEHYQIPATVFVTTGSLGHEFWWDNLERVLLSSAMFPERFSMEIKDGNFEWLSIDRKQNPALSYRKRIIKSIYRSLLLLSPVERETAISQLWAMLGITPDDNSSGRSLTVDELIELAAGDLIDIGAHTVTHPVLAALSIPEQRVEIQKSKVHLEKILDRPVTSFAYPNGSSSQVTLEIVRESGFYCACASNGDLVRLESDCFQLPRHWIPDWNGKEFLGWLRFWL